MRQKEEVGKRLKTLIDHLGMTQKAFGKEAGIEAGTVLNRIINNPDRAPSFEVLSMISRAFPQVNMNWVITGSGDILLGGSATDSGRIKYYHLSQSSDMRLALSDKIEPTAEMNLYGYRDCDYAFDVVGLAMAPKFMPGDIVICKRVGDSSIIIGQPYLVISDEFQVIRYLKDIKEGAEFVFSAENRDYPDITLKGGAINELCAVVGKIRRETY